MNYDGWGDFERPVFGHSKPLREIEEQLYGHVLSAVDWDALHRWEETLFYLLTEQMKMDDELALDLSAAIMDRALHRVAEDNSRYGDCGPPDGVTEAEKAAVAFDETCRFCLVEKDRAERPARDPADDEPCECCEMLVRSWREEHAEVLAKAGIAGAEKIAKRDRKRHDEGAS